MRQIMTPAKLAALWRVDAPKADARAVDFECVLNPAEAPRRSADMEGTCKPVEPADARLRAKLRPAPFRGCNSRRREVAGRCCRLGSWRLSAYPKPGRRTLGKNTGGRSRRCHFACWREIRRRAPLASTAAFDPMYGPAVRCKKISTMR